MIYFLPEIKFLLLLDVQLFLNLRLQQFNAFINAYASCHDSAVLVIKCLRCCLTILNHRLLYNILFQIQILGQAFRAMLIIFSKSIEDIQYCRRIITRNDTCSGQNLSTFFTTYILNELPCPLRVLAISAYSNRSNACLLYTSKSDMNFATISFSSWV